MPAPENPQELNKKIAELEDVQKANLNLLDDLEKERLNILAAKAKDEAIFNSIGEGLVAVDNSRRIMAINDTAIDMLDLKGKDPIGQFITDLPLEDNHGDPIPLNKRPTTLSLESGKGMKADYLFVRKDQAKTPIAITTAPIILNGQTIGLIEIIRDITRENELDRAKNEFISIASHQLRTPLTGIQWVIERFTKKEKLTQKGKEYLNDIHASAKRLAALVDLMLNLSRIEAGKIGITPEEIEVVGFIQDFLDEIVPLRDKKNLHLLFEDHPPKLVATTDKSALRNIVQNLVSNAIEYTPKGGTITVMAQEKGPLLHIEVRDTGIGIPRSEQSHLFEKFVRASNAKAYKTDGTGIGLYVAERSVDRLHGKIWFASEENKGSVFYVEIPLQLIPEKSSQSEHAVI